MKMSVGAIWRLSLSSVSNVLSLAGLLLVASAADVYADTKANALPPNSKGQIQEKSPVKIRPKKINQTLPRHSDEGRLEYETTLGMGVTSQFDHTNAEIVKTNRVPLYVALTFGADYKNSSPWFTGALLDVVWAKKIAGNTALPFFKIGAGQNYSLSEHPFYVREIGANLAFDYFSVATPDRGQGAGFYTLRRVSAFWLEFHPKWHFFGESQPLFVDLVLGLSPWTRAQAPYITTTLQGLSGELKSSWSFHQPYFFGTRCRVRGFSSSSVKIMTQELHAFIGLRF